jgi:hypothetical protein
LAYSMKKYSRGESSRFIFCPLSYNNDSSCRSSLKELSTSLVRKDVQ